MGPLKVDGGKGVVSLEPSGTIHFSLASGVRIEEAEARAAMASAAAISISAGQPRHRPMDFFGGQMVPLVGVCGGGPQG